MNDTREDIELSSLEDLFNEPHCNSNHRSPRNPVCTHKVVATVVFGCGCSLESCLMQVKYSQGCKSRMGRIDCSQCGSITPSANIIILPKG